MRVIGSRTSQYRLFQIFHLPVNLIPNTAKDIADNVAHDKCKNDDAERPREIKRHNDKLVADKMHVVDKINPWLCPAAGYQYHPHHMHQCRE